MNPFNKCTLF